MGGNNRKRLFLIAILFVALFHFELSPVLAKNQEDDFTIRIPLSIGSRVVVIKQGSTIELGEVHGLPKRSKHPSFTASAYGLGGSVVATAANAHHLLLSVENGAGRTISLVPMETFTPTSSAESSITVEGKGGIGLWGEFSPFVGSELFIVSEDGTRTSFNHMDQLNGAIALEIEVRFSKVGAKYLEIENHSGGKAWYRDEFGEDHVFGTVVSPVSGTGRFAGTLYEKVGWVRANHPGVICVSTSPRGVIGGFQIIPMDHTYSRGMNRTREMGQYLILSGINGEHLAGAFPFFSGIVRPGDANLQDRTIGKVLAKIQGEWYLFPEMPSWTEDSLSHIQSIRILLTNSSGKKEG